MSSTAVTIEEAFSTHTDWSELASRENDGLAVSLLWDRATDRVKVIVGDTQLDEEFELEIAGSDALDAFHHPFAYAAGRGLGFGAAVSDAYDLQT